MLSARSPVIATDAGLVFHHVGVACDDLRSEQRQFELLGYTVQSDIFEDRVQGVRGLFMGGQAPRVELLEPFDASPGVLSIWLSQRIKLYHLAYTVPNVVTAIDALRKQRAKVVVHPVAAVAFAGRSIAFLMLPNRLLIELISLE